MSERIYATLKGLELNTKNIITQAINAHPLVYHPMPVYEKVTAMCPATTGEMAIPIAPKKAEAATHDPFTSKSTRVPKKYGIKNSARNTLGNKKTVS